MKSRRLMQLPLLAVFFILPVIVAASPLQRKWEWQAETNVHAAPVVADLADAPGLETVVIDAERGVVKCLSAQGLEIWRYAGGFADTVASVLALGGGETGPRLVFSVDGFVYCLDAAAGTLLWKAETGTASSLLQADLDNDGADEIAAVTGTGITALSGDGEIRWTFGAEEAGGELEVAGPLAAADLEMDGAAELFVTGKTGPLCIDGGGMQLWRTMPGARFSGGPAVADVDNNGILELYCVAEAMPALYAFDADLGDLLWKCRLPGRPDPEIAGTIAMGDLEGDQRTEIAVSDAGGHITLFSGEGEIIWIHTLPQPVATALSIADLDGDNTAEILAASPGNALYCISPDGTLNWIHELRGPLLQPATVSDMDLDGVTDVLLAAFDGSLRCMTLNGRYNAAMMLWPCFRGNPARTAAYGLAAPGEAAAMSETAMAPVWDSEQLLPEGGFEEIETVAVGGGSVARPAGWDSDSIDGTWETDTETRMIGKAAVRVESAGSSFALVSRNIPVDSAMTSLTVTALGRASEGAPQRAFIAWWGGSGLIRRDEIPPAAEDNGWQRYMVNEVRPPRTAMMAVIRLESEGTAWWDGVQVTGIYQRPPEQGVFYNQAGYDLGAPKYFTAWSTWRAANARFCLLDNANTIVHSGNLEAGERITGRNDADWGAFYWRGNFTKFDEAGDYRIEVEFDGRQAATPLFPIGRNNLFARTVPKVLACFQHHRTGIAAPGYHEPCHLDDTVEGRDTHGGWFDGGSYSKRDTPRILWELIRTWGACQALFRDIDTNANQQQDLFEEIQWGADLILRSIREDGTALPMNISDPLFWGPPSLETDNEPGTGDERAFDPATGGDSSIHAAALARYAHHAKGRGDVTPHIAAADRALNRALEDGIRGPLQFSAAMDLYRAAGQQKYADLARELKPPPGPECPESFVYYSDIEIGITAVMINALQKEANALVEKAADNPFGVLPFEKGVYTDYFNTSGEAGGVGEGNSRHLLEAAAVVAKAWRFMPSESYRIFIYNQLNWILGNNPFGVCMIEGAGKTPPPSWYHRYAFAGIERGAVPGAIANGIAAAEPGRDVPYFDLRGTAFPESATNGFALYNNALYLNTLGYLYRITLFDTR
jgi:outer membrane protein assembly factor BamB